jgi:uncharacterized protein (DUF736 family)
MIIGNFRYNKRTKEFAGSIMTIGFYAAAVAFAPLPKMAATDPDYSIELETAFDIVEIGSAWKQIDDEGRAFLGVVLDSPILPRAVCAELILNKDGKKAILWWDRKDMGTPEFEQAA